MPGPVLSPEQKAQLLADKSAKESFIAALSAQIEGKTANIAKLTVSDSSFKTFFNYYNTDIIGKYEDERKAIDGKYIASPISESDIVGTANVDGSVRTTPSLPDTDIVRVDEFDGGPLVQSSDHEQTCLNDQEILTYRLTNGFTFTGSLGSGVSTASVLTGASTTLNVTSTGAFTLNINDQVLVTNGSTVAAIQITSVTNTTPPVIPPALPGPTTMTLGIQVLVIPIGTIGTGANLQAFTGFNNTERTNKLAANMSLQGLMDYFLLTLSEILNDRIDIMDLQLVALNANQDPNTTQADPIENIEESKAFIENYLMTLLINDTGLNQLTQENELRFDYLISRISDIEANASTHYDARYDMANNRANTSRGTLRLQVATEDSLGTTQDFIASAQAQIDAITSLL